MGNFFPRLVSLPTCHFVNYHLYGWGPQKMSVWLVMKRDRVKAGSAKANGRDPKSCLG